MLLSEYYRDSKYSENGKNFEVLVFGKNQRSKFTVRCIVCNDINTVTAASVLSGRKPCFCSVKSHNSPTKMFDRLLEVLKTKPIKLLQEGFTGAKSPLKVECLVCGKVWNSSYNSIVLKDCGCPMCGRAEKFSEEFALDQIQQKIVGTSMKLLKFEYLDTGYTGNCKTKLQCTACTMLWETSYSSILNGSGCPSCAKFGFQKDKPAVLYVLRVISEGGILLGYKYGITCDLHRRILQHNKVCKPLGITFETSFVWNYKSGFYANSHESTLKKTFEPYFKKYELPSGFSETINLYQLGELLDIQNRQYRKDVCHHLV